MGKYVYPAVFTTEKEGGYSVLFPDLTGCYTCGDSLDEAMSMAEDVLAFTLYSMEKKSSVIPSPSRLQDLKVKKNEFVNYIHCDTIGYQKRNNNKAVRKSVTIPEWINEAAVQAELNFSQVLQDAIKEKLHLA